jgi:oligopeptide transport system ATP-binding protein
MGHLLEINHLQVSFKTYGGEVQAVRDVSFHVKHGETIAIVGESGCGKSVTAKTIMKLLPQQAEIKQGEILLNGVNLVNKKEKEMLRIRGNDIGMIFQDPMTSLNPTSKVGYQIAEGLMKHKNISKKAALDQAVHMLETVGIPQPDKRINQYPHEFSGGMRQRVMIAIALACQPKLLIADEPTTALDVTIQAQILKLMKQLQDQMDTSIILITHDLGVVAEMCDRVVVMYAGQVVESGTVREIFSSPSHPYTESLLKSVPRLDMDRTKKLKPIIGTPPDLLDPPKGCSFFPRCEKAMRVCKDHSPTLDFIRGAQHAACWLHHPMKKEVENAK